MFGKSCFYVDEVVLGSHISTGGSWKFCDEGGLCTGDVSWLWVFVGGFTAWSG